MSNDTKAPTVTGAQLEMLDYARTMRGHGFAGFFTGRIHLRRDAEALVEAGLLKHISLVVCDGDGHHTEPERERLGYELVE